MMAQVFAAYLTLNLVLGAAVILLLLARPLAAKLKSRFQLRLHYWVLAFSAAVSFTAVMVNGGELARPVVKVWSQPEGANQTAQPLKKAGVLQLAGKKAAPIGADHLFLFATGLGIGAGLLGLFFLIRGKWQLTKIVRQGFLYKQIGRAKIVISDEVRIPFSYRTLTTAYVVLPSYLLTNSKNLRMTAAHEFQHHRQGDTRWAYPLALVRAVCFFNPFVHLWNIWIGELQEFACDEALVGRQSVRTRDYARCLIEVAETAWVQGEVPAGATGMILLNRAHLLNRRIQNMFQKKKINNPLAWALPFALIAGLLTATAFAAKGLVQDRRISLAQAQELARVAQKDSQIPIVINQEVLKYLNYFIGTPEGREKMRAGLLRMETYRPLITAKINEYQAPMELMALPLIESGYKNLESRTSAGARGLWQFIVTTARNFGLVVHQQVDQRLDEELATDAAMRYLQMNRLRFKDWHLSILSYNAGENAVQQAMIQTGSRDPWVLVRESRLNRESKDYLPKVIAAMVVMKNPSSVAE